MFAALPGHCPGASRVRTILRRFSTTFVLGRLHTLLTDRGFWFHVGRLGCWPLGILEVFCGHVRIGVGAVVVGDFSSDGLAIRIHNSKIDRLDVAECRRWLIP